MVAETKTKAKVKATTRTTVGTLLKKAQELREERNLTNREAAKLALRWIGTLPKHMNDELLEDGALYRLENLDTEVRKAVRREAQNGHSSEAMPALGDPSGHLAIQNQARAEAGYRVFLAEFKLTNAEGVQTSFGRFDASDLDAYLAVAAAQVVGWTRKGKAVEAFRLALDEHNVDFVEELPSAVLEELVPGLQELKE